MLSASCICEGTTYSEKDLWNKQFPNLINMYTCVSVWRLKESASDSANWQMFVCVKNLCITSMYVRKESLIMRIKIMSWYLESAASMTETDWRGWGSEKATLRWIPVAISSSDAVNRAVDWLWLSLPWLPWLIRKLLAGPCSLWLRSRSSLCDVTFSSHCSFWIHTATYCKQWPSYSKCLNIGSRALSFKWPLLSVDTDVCLSVSVSRPWRSNISQT